jgi:hypothetical protein
MRRLRCMFARYCPSVADRHQYHASTIAISQGDGSASMRLDPVKRLWRLVTAASIVLAVNHYVALRTAQAGCSHLVVSQSNRSLDFIRLDAIVVGGPFAVASIDRHDQLAQPTPARRLPCSGPRCSSRDPLPIPTATPGSTSLDQWAAVSAADVDPTIAPSNGPRNEQTPRSVLRKPSIFHPPPA